MASPTATTSSGNPTASPAGAPPKPPPTPASPPTPTPTRSPSTQPPSSATPTTTSASSPRTPPTSCAASPASKPSTPPPPRRPRRSAPPPCPRSPSAPRPPSSPPRSTPRATARSGSCRPSTDPACATGFSAAGPQNTIPPPPQEPRLSQSLSALLPNQHYCARIVATNSAGTATSAVAQFTTHPVPPDPGPHPARRPPPRHQRHPQRPGQPRGHRQHLPLRVRRRRHLPGRCRLHGRRPRLRPRQAATRNPRRRPDRRRRPQPDRRLHRAVGPPTRHHLPLPLLRPGHRRRRLPQGSQLHPSPPAPPPPARPAPRPGVRAAQHTTATCPLPRRRAGQPARQGQPEPDRPPAPPGRQALLIGRPRPALVRARRRPRRADRHRRHLPLLPETRWLEFAERPAPRRSAGRRRCHPLHRDLGLTPTSRASSSPPARLFRRRRRARSSPRRKPHAEALARFDPSDVANQAVNVNRLDSSADQAHVLRVDAATHELVDVGAGSAEVVGLLPGNSLPACGIDPDGGFFSGITVQPQNLHIPAITGSPPPMPRGPSSSPSRAATAPRRPTSTCATALRVRRL